MASDPSIYAQLGQGVTPLANPLLQTQQGLQLQAAQSQVTAARAYQAAIDPTTGQLNENKLLGILQNTPGAGAAIPGVLQNLQARQKMQLDLNKAALDQTTARTNAVNGALAPLMRMGSNVTPQDILGTISGLSASGFPVGEFVQDAATTLPVKQPGMSSAQYGQQLQGWIVNHAARAWPAATQAEQFTPHVSYQNVGGQLVPVDLNPNTSTAPTLGLGLTPSEQTDQVKGPVGPNGQQTVMTRAAYAQQNGLGGLVNGGAPGQPSPFGTGRLPSALLNPNRPPDQSGGSPAGYAPPTPAATPASVAPPSAAQGGLPAPFALPPSMASTGATQPPAPGTPAYITHADERFPTLGSTAPQAPASPPQSISAQPGAPAITPAIPPVGAPVQSSGPLSAYGTPMVTGLGPGQTAGVTAAGDASAKQWAQLQSSVGGSAGRIYQLQSALGDLQALGPTGTGPSAGTLNNVRSYLQSLPVIGQSLGVDPSKVASYDEANKYLTAYAAARASRFGGGTDQQLATTLSSNASTHISNLAAQDVVKANIGLERMDQSQIAGFQQGLDPMTGQPTGQQFTPDQFADYSSKWNTAHDARAFVADHITPQQFGTMLSGMSPADQAKFGATLNSGIEQGFINPPAWMQPQQPVANTPAAPQAAAPLPANAPIVPAAAPPAQAAPAAPTATQASAAPPPMVNGNGLPAIVGGF